MIELYDNLMKLCAESDKGKFFYTDFVSPFETKFRIFSYNYASYSDWLLDDALECRGIMFEMDDNGPVRIAARPMEKFFNLGENPMTMDLNLDEVVLVTAKADGSLVSTYMDQTNIAFKSKGSIKSSQAAESLQVFKQPHREAFRARVTEITEAGYTCNMEYVAPTNRIVLPYQERDLILLNVRHNETGEYIPYPELFKDAALRPFLVEAYDLVSIENVRGMKEIEGFVYELASGQKFKLKTEWYCALHHTKDSINNNERLFEVVVAGGADDVIAMFTGDDYAREKVNAFTIVHLDYLSNTLGLLLDAQKQLAGKDRREFAIKGQELCKPYPGLFSVLMNTYQRPQETEQTIAQINKVFLKNHKLYIPSDYQAEVILPE
ncbi:RNA ligase A [Escherichia phage CJ20]|uniref:RNA ligase 1 n=1 Tax=Shigella phage SP18 TaxID=645664 RepID=E3SF45_BPSP8|nr:RNA ligase and tail fiber protein attachment catalyst [Shigella phage SP18]ADO19582.1 RNA ligase 1 and tail fiber attachment catalyst [Shigella phage SP18]QMP18696.1 RNA ligase A [Escherichia phage CJ20]